METHYLLRTLLTEIRLIYRVIATSLHPIHSINSIAYESAHFLYALLQHILIDFATHTIKIMWNLHWGAVNAALPSGGLIMRVAGQYVVQAPAGGDVQKLARPFDKNFLRRSETHLARITPQPSVDAPAAGACQTSKGATTSQEPPLGQDMPPCAA